jgi:hypothetical protein
MRILMTLGLMFIGSFIIQYLLMSLIMVNNIGDFTNSLGKFYMSIIMGLYMIIVEVMMHDHHYDVISTKYYIIIGALIVAFILLYRTQQLITDKQYLEGMIEHHSMAILTSNKILEKTDNYNIAKLAKNILQTQQDEIILMKELLKK